MSDVPTSIVVPCHDEAGRLPANVFTAFMKAHPQVRFFFVDDGSADDTLARLRELAEAHPRSAEVLALPRNRGKAEAVRAGMGAAFASDARFAGYWDADLATPLAEIPRFVRMLAEDETCLMLLGARVGLLGWPIQRPVLRHYAGRVFGTLASLALALPVYDTQCGAKLFRVTAETRALFREPFSSRWLLDVEILARLLAARRAAGESDAARGLREIPLRAWQDVAGTALRPHDFFAAVWQLRRIRRRYGV